MPDRFLPAVTPPEDLQAPAWWFAFRGDLLLVQVRNGSFSVPLLRHPQDLSLRCLRSQYLGVLDGRHCFSAELHPESSPASGTAFDNLRALYPSLGDRLFALAGRAKQIVDWDRNHQFCGRCGSPTATHERDRSRVCPGCGLESFPRLAPAIIVLIARGEELLLGRSPHFPAGVYSILAGFVEPGETLEEAVEREIAEEVGTSGQERPLRRQPALALSPFADAWLSSGIRGAESCRSTRRNWRMPAGAARPIYPGSPLPPASPAG